MERQWVRNHQSAGSVVGRFVSHETAEVRAILVVQTFKGTMLIPEDTAMPIESAYMVRQAGLDLEGVIRVMLDVGLTLDDAQEAWDRAMTYHRKITDALPEQTEARS